MLSNGPLTVASLNMCGPKSYKNLTTHLIMNFYYRKKGCGSHYKFPYFYE